MVKKHVALFLVVLLALPVVAFAELKNTVNIGKAVINDDNTITVPVEISNRDRLTAIDIPLKYSEGVTLKEVSFAGTRVEYFDFKVGRVLADQNTAIIGLFSQMSPTRKPELEAGTGVIANLIFELKSPDVAEFTIEPTTLVNPNHTPMFIYRHFKPDGSVAGSFKESVEFGSSVVSLSGSVSAGLPTVFELDQNYPNPFNPTTDIAFALPVQSNVELTVFNVLGQKVATLASGVMPAGKHQITWKSTNDDGQAVASGVYFYRLTTDKFTDTRKMLLLK